MVPITGLSGATGFIPLPGVVSGFGVPGFGVTIGGFVIIGGGCVIMGGGFVGHLV